MDNESKQIVTAQDLIDYVFKNSPPPTPSEYFISHITSVKCPEANTVMLREMYQAIEKLPKDKCNIDKLRDFFGLLQQIPSQDEESSNILSFDNDTTKRFWDALLFIWETAKYQVLGPKRLAGRQSGIRRQAKRIEIIKALEKYLDEAIELMTCSGQRPASKKVALSEVLDDDNKRSQIEDIKRKYTKYQSTERFFEYYFDQNITLKVTEKSSRLKRPHRKGRDENSRWRSRCGARQHHKKLWIESTKTK